MSDFARLLQVAREATPPPVVVDRPVIQNATKALADHAVVGEALTCTQGNWNGEPGTYDFRWRSNQVDIGVSGDAYTVRDADKGHSLDCLVIASNVGGSGTAASNGVQITGVSAEERKKT